MHSYQLFQTITQSFYIQISNRTRNKLSAGVLSIRAAGRKCPRKTSKKSHNAEIYRTVPKIPYSLS